MEIMFEGSSLVGDHSHKQDEISNLKEIIASLTKEREEQRLYTEQKIEEYKIRERKAAQQFSLDAKLQDFIKTSLQFERDKLEYECDQAAVNLERERFLNENNIQHISKLRLQLKHERDEKEALKRDWSKKYQKLENEYEKYKLDTREKLMRKLEEEQAAAEAENKRSVAMEELRRRISELEKQLDESKRETATVRAKAAEKEQQDSETIKELVRALSTMKSEIKLLKEANNSKTMMQDTGAVVAEENQRQSNFSRTSMMTRESDRTKFDDHTNVSMDTSPSDDEYEYKDDYEVDLSDTDDEEYEEKDKPAPIQQPTTKKPRISSSHSKSSVAAASKQANSSPMKPSTSVPSADKSVDGPTTAKSQAGVSEASEKENNKKRKLSVESTEKPKSTKGVNETVVRSSSASSSSIASMAASLSTPQSAHTTLDESPRTTHITEQNKKAKHGMMKDLLMSAAANNNVKRQQLISSTFKPPRLAPAKTNVNAPPESEEPTIKLTTTKKTGGSHLNPRVIQDKENKAPPTETTAQQQKKKKTKLTIKW